MKHIMLVEDEVELAQLVRDYLEAAGFEVSMFHDGQDAYTQFQQRKPSLMILDLMVPRMDGLTICRKVREQSDLPIIMVTARTEEIDRVLGLNMGADDYLCKPFSPKELVARVGALLRRIQRPPSASTVLVYGPLAIDSDRHTVQLSGEDLRLTAKEFLLLKYLIEHRGRVLSRDLLLTDVWSYQYTGGTRTVDVHIRRLREKVPFLGRAITTIKQFGYKLEDPAPVP